MSRYVSTMPGLTVHYLECGRAEDPVLLLLHGFPELAFSWRKVMPQLADAGFRVIAPDQRGYGRTTGWDTGFDVDLEPYRMPSLVLDQVALLAALEIDEVVAVVGHDFGSPVAAWCALIRPDLFRRVALMSAPFPGPPEFVSGDGTGLDRALAELVPPRKHYQRYYSESQADEEMRSCPQGLEAFLKQYYYLKSAAWKGNHPLPLSGWQAEQLATMPGYYIMPREQTMAEVVALDCRDQQLDSVHAWLSKEALDVYACEFARTGFQGGLNWYRAMTSERERRASLLFSGLRITVPAAFIAGEKDWGRYQSPGALKAMEGKACADFRGTHVIPEAGHWVQQEQPGAVADVVLRFVQD